VFTFETLLAVCVGKKQLKKYEQLL